MNNELQHHGIEGQHWGIRRYQNSDGSLTAEGRKRYYKSDGKLTFAGKRYAKRLANEAAQKELEEKKREATKRIEDYSDEELKRTVDRLRNEKFYKELMSEKQAATVSKGKKYADQFLDVTLDNLIKKSSEKMTSYAVDKVFKMLTDTNNQKQKSYGGS